MSVRTLAISLIVGLAGVIATPAGAACVYPGPASATMPDGATADKEQMLAAQRDVKSYVAKMQAYLDCLDAESADLGEVATDEQKAMHTQRYNAAVDAMHQFSERFNQEVRAYKEANR